MPKVQISARKLKSYKRAEKMCRVLRWMVTRPGNVLWPVTAEEMPVFTKLFCQWMDSTGEIKYKLPEEWPTDERRS